jgi:hypothetical protein
MIHKLNHVSCDQEGNCGANCFNVDLAMNRAVGNGLPKNTSQTIGAAHKMAIDSELSSRQIGIVQFGMNESRRSLFARVAWLSLLIFQTFPLAATSNEARSEFAALICDLENFPPGRAGKSFLRCFHKSIAVGRW